MSLLGPNAAPAACALLLRMLRSKPSRSSARPTGAISLFLISMACIAWTAGCGGGSGGSSNPPGNPTPSLSSLTPNTATAGGPALTVTVSGSNFISSSTVQWNGSPRTATYLSSTSLQAAISAADIATAGTASVTVSTPAPGGGTSSPLTFTIDNPVPAIASLTPNAVVAGTSGFALTVTGSNFVSTSTVQWNSSPRTTTYVSSTSLQAAISAADIATPGTAAVTVFNPTPGGGTSAPATFTIRVPPPAITLMTPSSAVAGGAAFTVVISGTRFEASSVVNWNGSPRTTTFVSNTSLQAAVTASDIAAIGTAKVTVVNPVADGGTSSPSAFFVGSSGGSNFAMTVVNQAAQDIVFDPVNNLFYLSVNASASTNPTTICVLDPSTFTITSAIPLPAASNPNHLAISGDSQFLYAGLDGSSSVQRFGLPGLANDLTIPLAVSPSSGTFFVSDLQAAPGAPHTIAVALGNATTGPPGGAGLAIFDDGTARPTTVPGAPSTGNIFNTIQWGSDATRLFAADTYDDGFNFYSISVNTSGATLDHNFGSRFGSSGIGIHFDKSNNLIYSDVGPSVDSNGIPSGAFAASGTAMVPDSTLGTAFFASGIGVQSFDITHFSPITFISLPGPTGFPIRLIRWAQNGLALITDNGQAVLVGGNFISSAPPLTFTPPPIPVTPPVPAPNAPTISALLPSSAIAGSSGFTVTVTGSAFDPAATVQFDGTALPTTFVSSAKLTATIAASAIATPVTASVTVANPSSSGGVSAPSTFFIGSTGGTSQGGSGFAVTVLNQPAKDLKFDPVHNVIYLSVPGTANNLANTIAVLDPVSATVVGEQFAGSEPNHLALSDDQQFLYVSSDGSNSVQRFILPTLQPDVSYGLGASFRWGPYYALDLQVAPGASHTTAVSLGVTPVSPSAQGGLVIFDDATARPATIPGFGSTTNLFDSLQWGSDAMSLFAANLETTGDDFYTIAITPNGASLTADYSGLVQNARIHFDPATKLVYADDGQVVNPATGTDAARFVNAASSMVPDSNLNLAFFVSTSGITATIQSFNLTTRALVDSITIPNVFADFPQHVIRWGQNGLAFTTNTGQLYLVGGNFIH
jgi:hypothetical protein